MYIGQNIARIRKEQKITQEELGERVGVSNQAVSKWENGNASPDISLLPMIASALHVSLQELFESENVKTINKIAADDYPVFALDELRKSFFCHSRCRFLPGGKTEDEQLRYQREQLKNGEMLGCISNKNGAVVIRDGFAFIDTNFKDGDIWRFCTAEFGSILKALSDPSVRKTVAYIYAEGFKRSKTSHAVFSLTEIKESCDLTEEAAVSAVNLLLAAKIITGFGNKDKKIVYSASFSKLLYVTEILRLAEMLYEEEVWLVVRDSSVITDYSFEACADQK